MKVRWVKDKCPQALIEEIRLHVSINHNKQISYNKEFLSILDAVFGKVDHAYTLDHDILFREFLKAVGQTIYDNTLSNPDKILSNFQRNCNVINNRNTKYVLLTSVSYKDPHKLKKRRINSSTISFSTDIPKKYRASRQALQKSQRLDNLSEQAGYTYVTVTVLAPDLDTAFKIGMGTLDIYRAIWQLVIEKRRALLANTKTEEYPTNSIISIGQFHTIHREDGKQASPNVWIDKDFRKQQIPTFSCLEKMEKNIDYMLRTLRKNIVSEHVVESLKMYINALDIKTIEFRYARLWAVFEKLLKTDDATTMVKRISFFYEDRDTHREILESLRIARNICTHSGVKSFNVELKSFVLMSYLEKLMLYFVFNELKAKNLNDILDFLSSPRDLESIELQMKRLKQVRKFIS